ncbi:hypothetical protein NDN08_007981 [Rhodosorus marinus]|uniref:Uncharacterized protein n=1 Tax=Rhodosorus marinus TaxID=101924 RepID=A0AAV8V2P4_9RHOD|nr:hypothetical protein NDN08_007981 [Rhodosorus marinus]
MIVLTSDDSMTTQIENLRKENAAIVKQAREGRDKLSLYRVKFQQKERDSMQLERLLDEKTGTIKEVEETVENLRITKETLTKQEINVRKEIEMTSTFRQCAMGNFDRLQETLKQQEAELRARQESLTRSRDPGIENGLGMSPKRRKLLNDARATIAANEKRMRAMEDENKSLDAQLEKLREDSAERQALRTGIEGNCSDLDVLKRKYEAEKTKRDLMETELRELQNAGAMHFAAAEKKLRLAQEELQKERAVRETLTSEILKAKAKMEEMNSKTAQDRITPSRLRGVDIASPVGGKSPYTETDSAESKWLA